jgi:hypothetical protein
VGVRKLRLARELSVVGVVRAAITGALAALLVCVVFAQAVPRPLPAPAGMRDHVVTLRELEVRVQSLERDAWTWRWFWSCIKHHYVVQGDVVFVEWKLTKGCVAK